MSDKAYVHHLEDEIFAQDREQTGDFKNGSFSPIK